MSGIVLQWYKQLSNDPVVLFFLAATLLWPGIAYLLYRFLLSKYIDAQRWAEFPRVLFWRLWLFLSLSLFRLAFVHLTTFEGGAAGSGSIRRYAGGAVIFTLNALCGYALWISLSSVLTVIRDEFIERRFKTYGKDKERNTATILSGFAYPLCFVLILAYVAWLFNLQVAGYLAAFGGLGIAVGLAVKSLLENVFSGLALSLDAPFSTNDLIKIGDEQIYQVLKRGSRMLTVRNINTHEIVYVPNNKLAAQGLVDITRPTDDLRVVILVNVPYTSDLRQVRSILIDIAYGHPHVVGPYESKRTAILNKVYRLYVRGVFDECFQHFVELARLKSENDLNEVILNFKRDLERYARYIDRVESQGFDRDEKKEMRRIAVQLVETSKDLARSTTEWLILLRNCTARGRRMLDAERKTTIHAWDPLRKWMDKDFSPFADGEDPDVLSKTVPERMAWLTQNLGALCQWLDDELIKIEKANGKNSDRHGVTVAQPNQPSAVVAHESSDVAGEISWHPLDESNTERIRKILDAFRIANALSQSAKIPPEGELTKAYYEDGNYLFRESIEKTYNRLGELYGDEITKFAEQIVEEEPIGHLRSAAQSTTGDSGRGGFSVQLCRTRQEDLYLSEMAVTHMLNHPLCEESAGQLSDDDERSDLAEMIRVWGDKTDELLKRAHSIESMLKQAKSTAIDTRLREFATWLKDYFKDPFPAWKYPIAPVEGFGDSAVNLAMKMYVDNVRMEKYLRPFNTNTQYRLRVIERLGNVGIQMPFPKRDIRIVEDLRDAGPGSPSLPKADAEKPPTS